MTSYMMCGERSLPFARTSHLDWIGALRIDGILIQNAGRVATDWIKERHSSTSKHFEALWAYFRTQPIYEAFLSTISRSGPMVVNLNKTKEIVMDGTSIQNVTPSAHSHISGEREFKMFRVVKWSSYSFHFLPFTFLLCLQAFEY